MDEYDITFLYGLKYVDQDSPFASSGDVSYFQYSIIENKKLFLINSSDYIFTPVNIDQ